MPDPSKIAILFADLQDGIVQNSRTNPPGELRRAAKALAEIGAILGLPMFTTLVPQGPERPKAIVEVGESPTFVRTTASPFDDAPLREAVLGSGIETLVIAGVASEVATLHAALGALQAGLKAHVVVDACGGLSDRTERAAWSQIERAGGVLSSVASLATTLSGDFATEEGRSIMGVLRPLFQG